MTTLSPYDVIYHNVAKKLNELYGNIYKCVSLNPMEWVVLSSKGWVLLQKQEKELWELIDSLHIKQFTQYQKKEIVKEFAMLTYKK